MATKFPGTKSVQKLIDVASDIFQRDGSIRLGTLILATCEPTERNYKYCGLIRHLRQAFAGLDEVQQWKLYRRVLKRLNDDYGPLDCSLAGNFRDSTTTWQKASPYVPAALSVINEILAAESGNLKKRRATVHQMEKINRAREATGPAFLAYCRAVLQASSVTAQVLLG